MDHQYFTVEGCSMDIVAAGEKRRRGEGSLAIFAGEPRGWRAPVFLITDWFDPKEAIAKEVATILNSHAVEFFPSAMTKAQRQAEHDRRVLAGEI